MKIIIDTNFLLIPAQFKVDIFSEIDRLCDSSYKVYIFDKTINELEKIIKKQRGKHKAAANLALQLVKKFKINKLKATKNVDDAIVSLAKKERIIVATQDKELKKRLKGTRLIVLRKKSYLEFN